MGWNPTISNRQNTTVLQLPAVSGISRDTAIENAQTRDNQNTIKILHTVQDMAQFEKQWRDLEDRVAKSTNVFQSFDWCMNWAQTCTIDNDCYHIYVVTISRDDQCQLIWPMMTACSGPFHILNWLSEPFSQYGDVLAIADENLDTNLQLAWQKIQAHPFADSIRMRHVRDDATIAPFLKANARYDGQVDHAPFLEIDKFPTEEAYEARYNKNQRRRRKRIHKNLEQFGAISFTSSHDGDSFCRTLGLAIREKRKWLSRRGLYSKPVMGDELQVFFSDLAKNAKTLTPIASQLNAGDREISFEIALRYKGRHLGYITAHDTTLTDASPARLHMDFSQRAAINDGMATFDLMVPADPHKKTWSSNSIQTCDYSFHLNTRGAVYTAFYLKTLRPILRAVYLKSPVSFRRRITSFIS